MAYDWGFRARSSLQAAAVKAIAGTCARSAGHRDTFYGITAPYRKGRGFGGTEVVKEHLTSAHGAYVARPILSVADAAALTVMKIHYNTQDTSLRAIFARERPFAPMQRRIERRHRRISTQPCSEQLDFFSTRNSVEEPNHAKD